MGNRLLRVLTLPARAWRKLRGRELWHWVILKHPNVYMALGPYRTYKDAEKAALLAPDYHPRIVVELSWRHPWVDPGTKWREEVLDLRRERLSVRGENGDLISVHVDDCLLPPTED